MTISGLKRKNILKKELTLLLMNLLIEMLRYHQICNVKVFVSRLTESEAYLLRAIQM